MPKRTRDQQNKHNEARRNFIKKGKKAIFCVEHIKSIHPNIVKEASEIYDYLYEFYPNKRDLTKTEIYQRELKNKSTASNGSQRATEGNKQVNQIEPVLTIPLLQTPLQPALSISTETARVEEILPQIPVLTDEETDELVLELQNDPDLRYFFKDEPINEVTLPSGKSPEGTEPKNMEEEIDRIIRAEFALLGTDLPDIVFKDDELTQ